MDINKEIGKLKLVLALIVVVVILCAYFGISQDTTDMIVQWLVSIFVGMIGMLICGVLVNTFTFGLLENIKIPITIAGFTFYISVFLIVTFIVKLWIFGF